VVKWVWNTQIRSPRPRYWHCPNSLICPCYRDLLLPTFVIEGSGANGAFDSTTNVSSSCNVAY